MDLIYTDANRIDQGALKAYAFDLSFGATENDFEVTLDVDHTLESGAFVYIEGSEYGGIVDGLKTSTDSKTITHMGRTWHGVMNSKVIEPDSGADYLIVSGDANEILGFLIDRLGLEGLFTASDEASGITVKNYQFDRYILGYDGIKKMLTAYGAKLIITWENRSVKLSAAPIVDYSRDPVDDDSAILSVEKYDKKVNHLICLGKGELAERTVIHLYVDQFGRIGDSQYYTGIEEVTDTYDLSNAEDAETLRSKGIEQLKKLRNNDKAEISVSESVEQSYDIGDIVGASEMKSGVSVAAPVSQKIVRIKNGVISTEYQTGG